VERDELSKEKDVLVNKTFNRQMSSVQAALNNVMLLRYVTVVVLC